MRRRLTLSSPEVNDKGYDYLRIGDIDEYRESHKESNHSNCNSHSELSLCP